MHNKDSIFKVTDSLQIEWRKSTFANNIWVKDLGSADGYLMQMVKFEPGASFPRHQHSRAEFMYILEGELFQNGHKLSAGYVSVSPPLSIDDEVYSPDGCLFLLYAAD